MINAANSPAAKSAPRVPNTRPHGKISVLCLWAFCAAVLGRAEDAAPAAPTLREPEPVPAELTLAGGKRVADPDHAATEKTKLTITQQIDARLRSEAVALPKEWLRDEITAAQMIKETDAFFAEYLKRLSQTLAQSPAGTREDTIRRKEHVHDLVKQKRAVLLSHLTGSGSGLTLHRFDGGKDAAAGYVVMKDGEAYRSLAFRMNRPDPAIGDAVIAIPAATN